MKSLVKGAEIFPSLLVTVPSIEVFWYNFRLLNVNVPFVLLCVCVVLPFWTTLMLYVVILSQFGFPACESVKQVPPFYAQLLINLMTACRPKPWQHSTADTIINRVCLKLILKPMTARQE